MAVVLFEDALVDRLAPVTSIRPAYDICCGGNRLCELVLPLGQPIHGVVREHLRALQAIRYAGVESSPPAATEAHLLVNARLVPSPQALAHLQRGLEAPNDWAILENDRLVAAKLQTNEPLSGLLSAESYDAWLAPSVARPQAPPGELTLLQYPHEILTEHNKLAATGFEHFANQAGIKQLADGIFAADEGSFGPGVTTHARQGPIVVEQGALISPGAVLIGPVLIRRNAQVMEHAALKDGTVLGHTTKVGGEVEGSIIEPFSNKQHHGFLGHSYVGSWANIGAGTSNSDLKNTYGSVRFQYGGEKIDSGQQFLGCVLGDFVKTAINTSLFTGLTIGSFSNLYGLVTENVAPFVNYAKQFGSVTQMDPVVVLPMQQRMFSRRKIEQQVCDVDLIHALFAATQKQREGLASGPPSFYSESL